MSLQIIAKGSSEGDRWCRPLPDPTSGDGTANASITVGRVSGDWTVPWDRQISRLHCELTHTIDRRVNVKLLPRASNPIFFRGLAGEQFTVAAGEHFVIGSTRFSVTDGPLIKPSADSTHDFSKFEQTFDAAGLQSHRYQDAAGRIDALSRLPDILTGSQTESETLFRVVQLLAQQTPAASLVAIVAVKSASLASDAADILVLHGDQSGETQPHATSAAKQGSRPDPPSISRRLVLRAARTDQSVLHLYSPLTSSRLPPDSNALNGEAASKADEAAANADEFAAGAGEFAAGAGEFAAGAGEFAAGAGGTDPPIEPFTMAAMDQWAMAIPVPGEHSGRRLVIYLSGREYGGDRRDDVKFAGVVASIFSNLQTSRRLLRRQQSLRRFFSPMVMNTLGDEDWRDIFAPRETTLTVLFCDLRGFTDRTNRQSGDLHQLLSDVNAALTAITRQILTNDGVIGDFHGDAVMGFWGWPIARDDDAERAITAATAIRDAFVGEAISFRCGLGIATGPAIAGGIGSDDQLKVTALGPAVNLASRLESLTKSMNAEILLDSATMQRLRTPPSTIQDAGLVDVKGFDAPQSVFKMRNPT